MIKRKRMRLIVLCLGALMLVGAAAGLTRLASGGNQPAQLWGSDHTEWHTVAANTANPGPDHNLPVYMAVEVERLYGLRIGTPVRVRLKIITLTSTKVSFDTLMRGVLSRDSTAWRLASPPTVVSETTKNGMCTRIVEMTVAVWESPAPLPPPPPKTSAAQPGDQSQTDGTTTQGPDEGNATAGGDGAGASADSSPPAPQPPPPGPAVLWPFSVEFLYSTDNMANGQPQWQYIQTPAIEFGFSSLLDPGIDLQGQSNAGPSGGDGFDSGPTGNIASHYNSVGLAIIAVGLALALTGFMLGFAWLRAFLMRRRVPPVLPAAVSQYRDAIERAQNTRDVRPYWWQVGVAVRDRLGGASKTDAQLAALWEGHPLKNRIVSTLRILDQSVRRGTIDASSQERLDRLIAELDKADLAHLYKPDRLARVGSRVTAPVKWAWATVKAPVLFVKKRSKRRAS